MTKEMDTTTRLSIILFTMVSYKMVDDLISIYSSSGRADMDTITEIKFHKTEMSEHSVQCALF